MKQLLIIDNEETILFALKRYFAQLRYRVDSASELEEAEALVAHTRYDLVIADQREARRRGAEAFLYKPQPLPELARVAGRLLGAQP